MKAQGSYVVFWIPESGSDTVRPQTQLDLPPNLGSLLFAMFSLCSVNRTRKKNPHYRLCPGLNKNTCRCKAKKRHIF